MRSRILSATTVSEPPTAANAPSRVGDSMPFEPSQDHPFLGDLLEDDPHRHSEAEERQAGNEEVEIEGQGAAWTQEELDQRVSSGGHGREVLGKGAPSDIVAGGVDRYRHYELGKSGASWCPAAVQAARRTGPKRTSHQASRPLAEGSRSTRCHVSWGARLRGVSFLLQPASLFSERRDSVESPLRLTVPAAPSPPP